MGVSVSPVAWRTTVSFVDICPSTVIRSNERVDGAAKRGVGIVDLRVGLHEAEHGGEAGLDHAGALGLGGDGHAARLDAHVLRRAVGGHDRLRETRSRGPAQGSPAALRSPSVTRSISSGTPITPVSATTTFAFVEAQRLRGRRLHLERVSIALLARRRVRVAGVDGDRADGVRRRGCSRQTRIGAAAAAFRVRSTDEATSGASQTRTATSVSPPSLRPQCVAPGPEAGREDRWVELLGAPRQVHPALVEEARHARDPPPRRGPASGSGSGRPARRRPSRGCRSPRRRSRARRPTPGAGGCGRSWTRARRRRPGGSATISTNGSDAVEVVVEAAELLGVERPGELDVAARQQPLVERQEVRDEGERARRAHRVELLLDLGQVAVAVDAVGLDVLGDLGEVAAALAGARDARLGVDRRRS